jgi:radical SAM protein with 4Fe4S-binding SPASM domain
MTQKRLQYEAGDKAPALFSFITLRRESFGGILFNPFLPVELELNDQETLISSLCDGTNTINEILEELMLVFSDSPGNPVTIIDETLIKLNKACAIQLVDKPFSGKKAEKGTFTAVSDGYLSMPKSIIWDVTYACNLKCPHCLTDSGKSGKKELDTQEATRLIDLFSEAKVLYLSLSGGEPFMRNDILKLLAHIAGTGMRVDIATNGFSVPDRVIKSLRNLPVFNVQVSIDGIGEKHDHFRGQKGAFIKACNTLKRFKEDGLSTSISATATAQNVNQIGDLVDLALELECESFKAIPFIPAGRGARNEKQLQLSKQDVYLLTKTLKEKSKEHAGKILVVTETSFLFLLDPPASPCDTDGRMICSAGYDQLSVGADGTAYPCPFLHNMPLGNLQTDSLKEIWHKSVILNQIRNIDKNSMTGPCSTCLYAPAYCHGGCRASAYLATGDLRGSDPLCFRNLITIT